MDGQKISAIDRMNDTGPIEKASLTVAQRIRDARIAKFQNQDEFQKASGIPGPRIRQLELGTGGPPTNEEFNTMERVFEIYLRGKLIGQPKPQKGFKRNAGKETK